MIERIIEASVRNRFLVLVALVLTILWGAWAIAKTPLDAIPDLSDNQVIVFTDWAGRSPQVVEDQVTYPLVSNLQGLPGVRAVRAQSALGFSMIYVIFEDATDVYWARTRVLERLATVRNQLPPGVAPVLGPDGTGVGHVYWYTVESDRHDLGRLRAIQDWYLRLQLQSVPGVAEVASVGGYMRQYQVDVDPTKLRSYGVGIADVVKAVRASNNEVGGNVVEWNDSEYAVRGLGYVAGVADLENVVVKTGPGGTPVYVGQVATVQLGSDLRRGLLDKDGAGEVVGGIVVMRYGENAKTVIDRVKAKLDELRKGLPPGVRVEAAYDRSDLIGRAVATLEHALVEEAIAVSLVIGLFLLHVRSALIIVLSIPIAVLVSFVAMYHLGITSNIMSLGGVALAIGVLVDAGIVMVENAYRHLAERPDGQVPTGDERTAIILAAAQQVGRPIFFSLVIIVLSFLPIFLLTGQEGKLFHPLAATKSFAMVGAAILSITLVPVLMTLLLRGRLRPEGENPVSRFFQALYLPVLKLALRFKAATVAFALIAALAAVPLAATLGKEFMPPLDEGSLLYMPVTLPNVTVTEAKRQLQIQDRILKGFPEVELVLGKVGRAETATDPAPVSMVETIVLLKPRERWPDPAKTKDALIGEMDAALQIPGVTNGWTQPIINRINMLATGVRTDLGVKIYGPDLRVIEDLAIKAEAVLKRVPGAADVFAERNIGGRFVDIQVDRQAAARYGINVADAQEAIEVAIGGMALTTTVEGRERFPVRVRYARDFREGLDDLRDVYVNAADGTPIPLGQVAKLTVSEGPPMINSENSLLRGLVFLNVREGRAGAGAALAGRLLRVVERAVGEPGPGPPDPADRGAAGRRDHLRAALPDLPVGRELPADPLVGALRSGGRRAAAAPAGLQLLGRGLGRLHRSGGHRGRDRRGDADLPERGPRSPHPGGRRDGRRHRGGGDRGGRAAAAAEAHDRGRGADRPGAADVGDGDGERRDAPARDADGRGAGDQHGAGAAGDPGAVRGAEAVGAAARGARGLGRRPPLSPRTDLALECLFYFVLS
jgi:Cu(I)/Ag(I) efflux system membrane protein CusA/SilA